MNKYKASYTSNDVVKVFDSPCPHGMCYEAINYHVMRLVGSNHCRKCKYFKGLEKNGSEIIVKCEHPDGMEKQKSTIIIPGKVVKVIDNNKHGNI